MKSSLEAAKELEQALKVYCASFPPDEETNEAMKLRMAKARFAERRGQLLTEERQVKGGSVAEAVEAPAAISSDGEEDRDADARPESPQITEQQINIDEFCEVLAKFMNIKKKK